MSVFSKIKAGRAQAKAIQAEKTEKEKAQDAAAPVPYKHVPTHAASDAITGCVTAMTDLEKMKIQDIGRKRSSIRGSMYGTPRMGSTLSMVSYPSRDATPISTPRNYSYTNIAAGDYFNQPGGPKGKGKEATPPPLPTGFAIPMNYTYRPSVSRGVSYSEQPTIGEDELEMKDSARNGEMAAHRLHPAHRRTKSTKMDSRPQQHGQRFSVPRPLNPSALSTSVSASPAESPTEASPPANELHESSAESSSNSVTSSKSDDVGEANFTGPSSMHSSPAASTKDTVLAAPEPVTSKIIEHVDEKGTKRVAKSQSTPKAAKKNRWTWFGRKSVVEAAA